MLSITSYFLYIVIYKVALILLLVGIQWFSKVWIYFRHDDGHLYEPLIPLDQMFTITPCDAVVSYILKTDSLIDICELRDHVYRTFLSTRMTSAPGISLRYTRCVILGYAYKKPIPVEKLNLSCHIREEFCDKGANEDEFVKIVLEDNSRINTWDVPNWEIVLVHFPHEKRTTLLFKISHWMADGTSCRLLIDTLTGNETVYKIPKAGEPLTWKKKVGIVMSAPLGLWRIYKEVGSLKWNINPWLNYSTKLKDSPETFCQATSTVQFEKLKCAATKTDCKILAVIMSTHISTMKRFLEEERKVKGELSKSCGFIFPLPAPSHPAIFHKKVANCLKFDIASAPLNDTCPLQLVRQLNERVSQSDVVDGPLVLQWFTTAIFSLLPYNMFMQMWSHYYVHIAGEVYSTTVNPLVFSPKPYNVLNANVTSLHSIVIGNPEFYAVKGNMTLSPITRGNAVDIVVRASSIIFQTQAEADTYMKIYSEELDLLVKLVQES